MTSRSAPLFERSWARRLFAPALLCLLSLIPARAGAQPSDPFDLEWTAPPECPGQEEVRARLRKLAGLRNESAVPLRAEATITRNEGAGLHLRLVIHSGNLVGERNIDGKTCRDLVGASTVALVLLLRAAAPLSEDNLAGGAPPDSQTVSADKATGDGSDQPGAAQPENTSPTVMPASKGQPSVRPDADPKARLISARNWRLLVQFPSGAFGLGPLHAPNLGVALAVGASLGPWRFLAGGTIWRPTHASATIEFQQHNTNIIQQYGADIDRATVTMLACRALLISPVEIAPCATASVEHISARGTGAHVAGSADRATWLAAGLGAQARVYVAPWLSLFLGIDGELELSRPRLSIDGVGTIEHLTPAAATITVGSEWIF